LLVTPIEMLAAALSILHAQLSIPLQSFPSTQSNKDYKAGKIKI
jgi:hypothetical protein